MSHYFVDYPLFIEEYPNYTYSPFLKKQKIDQPCLTEQCAKRVRQENSLPDGNSVVTHVCCTCPKCCPRF